MQKALAQETKLLLETLYKPVSFWESSAKHKIETLAQIAAKGDPVAIPDLALLLLDRNHSVASAAASTIATLTKRLHPSELKWLDEAMRVRSPYKWVYPNPWAELRQSGLGCLQKFGANSVFALGLASFHFNGYVREEALRRLADIRDGSELPYLLLRLNDWVQPVREIAGSMVRNRIHETYAPTFVANIVIISGLHSATRGDQRDILQAIKSLLHSKAAQASIENGLASPEKEVKRLCYKLAFETTGAAQYRLVERALSEVDPLVRLYGLASLAAIPDTESKRQILSRFKADRFAPVRRKALEIVSEQFPEMRHPWLEQALLDNHPSIRGYAQSQIGKDRALDLRKFYISALAKAEGRNLYAAISGLGETGMSPDTSIVLSYASHSLARIRRSTLRTLAHLNTVEHTDLFFEHLSDVSPSVSREAMKALSKILYIVMGDRLWQVFAASSNAHVRRNTLFLIGRLSKWESVGYLVEALGDETTDMQQLVSSYLRRWSAQFNSSFAAPTVDQVERLRAALQKSRTKIDQNVLAQIEFGIRTFATS